MLNQLKNITALRDAVEAGNQYYEKAAQDCFGGLRDNENTRNLCRAIRLKSTDAALQWLAAVLPDMRVNTMGQHYDGTWFVVLGNDDEELPSVGGKIGEDYDLATALILAGLKAKIAQLQKEQDDD